MDSPPNSPILSEVIDKSLPPTPAAAGSISGRLDEPVPPTESHALANADHEVKGAVQLNHMDFEVKDLGWDKPETAPELIGGLSNEDLWTLIRRFNKQIAHVKLGPMDSPGGLDLNIADEEEFAPDKLRANIERLYMTVILGMMSFLNQIVLLRSWNQPRRTAAFCAGYFFAWFFDLLVPTSMALLVALITYPPSRTYLFPPVPVSLIDFSGSLKKPPAGVVGTQDTVTGAPEVHSGEAAEKEAANFVMSIGVIGLAAGTGEHKNPNVQPDYDMDKVAANPGPADLATRAFDARDTTTGMDKSVKHDKTKEPMMDLMWKQTRPIMRALADVADVWERFGNALSPTPPFPTVVPQLQLAAAFVAIFFGSFFVSSTMVVKGLTFGIGFGLFGQPVISQSLDFLNRTIPNWPQYLELRRGLLRGVPTNAQLTLTLLRIGEANHAPLPPPPTTTSPPTLTPDAPDTDGVIELTDTLASSPEEIGSAIHADRETIEHHHETTTKVKREGTIKRLLKGMTKGGVKTILGGDHAKAHTIGGERAKNRLGVVPKPKDKTTVGPVSFDCRFNGKKGQLYVITQAATPCISFTCGGRGDIVHDEDGVVEVKGAEWSIAMKNVIGLRKFGGLGWKSKLVVGWAMDKEVADGIEIEERGGKVWKVTAIQLQDDLFNRLIAVGGQKWEAW